MIRDYLSNFILRAPLSSGRSNLLESLIQVRETQSAFLLHARRNASVAAMCVCNPDRSPVTVARQLQRAWHRPRRWVISFSFKRK